MNDLNYAPRALAVESSDLKKITARLDDNVLALVLIKTLLAAKEQLQLVDQVKKALFYGKESKHVEDVRVAFDEKLTAEEFEKFKPAIEMIQKDKRTLRVLHATLGYLSEGEEFVDIILSKLLNDFDFDRANIIEEDGDAGWYLNLLRDEFGYTGDCVREVNIVKLEERNNVKESEGFDEKATINRDHDAERVLIENVINNHDNMDVAVN